MFVRLCVWRARNHENDYAGQCAGRTNDLGWTWEKTIKEKWGLQMRRPADMTTPVYRINDLACWHPSFRVTEPRARQLKQSLS